MANHTHYMLKAWVQDYTGCAEDFVLKFEGDSEDAETKNEARQALNRLHRIGDSILAG